MPILVHYGELALKGKNRHLFENRLVENIRSAGYRSGVSRLPGRILVESEDVEPLRRVFGISWMAKACIAEKSLESIKKSVLSGLAERATEDTRTFGVFVRRADKHFPLTSVEIARTVGLEVARNLKLGVDLKAPDVSVYIEIADKAFVFFEKICGLNGLPVGVSGRVLCLLSGVSIPPWLPI